MCQIAGRFLLGIGVGLASCIAPLYIQELSPTRLRGRMVVINIAMITGGQVIAYALDAGFANVSHGWRWMVGLGAVPAGLQLLFLFYLPESRWWYFSAQVLELLIPPFTARIMIRRGDYEAAHEVLGKIYSRATTEQVELKVKVLRAAVQQSVDISNSTTFYQRLCSILNVPVNRRALSM